MLRGRRLRFAERLHCGSASALLRAAAQDSRATAAIHISNTSGGIEVDHGAAPPPPPTSATSPIPTLSDVALASLAFVAAAFRLAMLKIRRA
jgi:hypothetical protein